MKLLVLNNVKFLNYINSMYIIVLKLCIIYIYLNLLSLEFDFFY